MVARALVRPLEKQGSLVRSGPVEEPGVQGSCICFSSLATPLCYIGIDTRQISGSCWSDKDLKISVADHNKVLS